MSSNAPEALAAREFAESSGDVVPALRANFGLLLGPLVAGAIWFMPTALEPLQQQTLAVVALMIVYWLAEPIDHGLTALIGCYLFWGLGIVKFSVAFSGFVNSTVWFLFGSLLMAEAAARTGLAKRLGCLLLRRIGSSYFQLLLGLISLSYLLTVFVPSGIGRIAILAPLAVGVVKASGAGERGNLARGLFVILTSLAAMSDVMILSGATSMLTRGLVEEHSGVQLLWSQWFVAFLPLSVATMLFSAVLIRWLYPLECGARLAGKAYFQNALAQMGPWSVAEKKALVWFVAAVGLWATDSMHHISPAVVGFGVAIALCLPNIGVLDGKTVRQTNFLVIAFCAGAISMGNVLMASNTLSLVTERLIGWIEPLVNNAVSFTASLYVAGFFYHFIFANRQSMLITSLPLLLQLGASQGLNPVVLSLLWTFAGGGGLFVYQSGVYVMGYSYGHFEAKDFLKVGVILTVVEGALLVLMVRYYWPVIGLNWLQ